MIRVDDDIDLRLISLKSAPVIFNSIKSSRAHLRKWLPFVDATKNILDTNDFIRSVLDSRNSKQDRVFEIWYKNNFAGLISLKEIDRINNKVELGYWLDSGMTGQGIMIRSVKRLIDHAFGELKMNRVVIKTAVGNFKSNTIAKNLYFTFEGIEREGELLNGIYHDLEIYSILKKDWK